MLTEETAKALTEALNRFCGVANDLAMELSLFDVAGLTDALEVFNEKA